MDTIRSHLVANPIEINGELSRETKRSAETKIKIRYNVLEQRYFYREHAKKMCGRSVELKNTSRRAEFLRTELPFAW